MNFTEIELNIIIPVKCSDAVIGSLNFTFRLNKTFSSVVACGGNVIGSMNFTEIVLNIFICSSGEVIAFMNFTLRLNLTFSSVVA